MGKMTFGIVHVRRSFRRAAGNGTPAACAPQTARVNAQTQKLRFRGSIFAPIDWRSIGTCLLQRNEFFLARLGRVLLAQRRIFGARLRIERCLLFFVQERIHHAYRAGRVEHVHRARAIMRRDFHRRVRPAGGGAAN